MSGKILRMAKPATPPHYAVEKMGVPDPAVSEYFVLNITQDPIAREALAFLGNKYRQHNKHQLSQECFSLLDSTRAVFAEVMEARQPKKKSGGKK